MGYKTQNRGVNSQTLLELGLQEGRCLRVEGRRERGRGRCSTDSSMLWFVVLSCALGIGGRTAAGQRGKTKLLQYSLEETAF